MALSSTIKCDTCHENKQVWYGSSELTIPTTCSDCKKRKEDNERQAHLDTLAVLPIEERLKMVEGFMYDHSRAYHPRKSRRY
jgi:hypothetical protein